MNIIKVYGSGCANCKKLEAMCSEVIQENNIDAADEKVTRYSRNNENRNSFNTWS